MSSPFSGKMYVVHMCIGLFPFSNIYVRIFAQVNNFFTKVKVLNLLFFRKLAIETTLRMHSILQVLSIKTCMTTLYLSYFRRKCHIINTDLEGPF